MKTLLLLLSALTPGAAPPPPADEVVIDAGAAARPAPAARPRPLHGVNGGPLNLGGTLDLTARWREAAVPLARLHDCHWPNPDVVDQHVVFPDPRADPADPKAYDFARTDEYVDAVRAAGAAVVYRLGESIEHQRVKRHVHPPRDPARWAESCAGVVRHFNDGWAGGHRFGIRYWEVWNEPDNRPAMWTGSDEEYFRLYSLTAKRLKKLDPGLKVGGPGLGNTGTLRGRALDPAPFLAKFLDHCRRDGAPLDFFSWHCYTADPAELPARAREVRRLLDRAGFPKAESHLNEWNYLPGGDWAPMLSGDARVRQRWHEEIAGPAGAAFVAAALLHLREAPVDAAAYFSAEPQGMGLFNRHGVPTKPFHAMKAFRALTEAGVALGVAGAPPGVTAGAQLIDWPRNPSGGVVVLVARPGAPGRPPGLTVRGLPWAGETGYEIRSVDALRDLDVVRTGVCPAGTARVDLGGRQPHQQGRPGVWLVRLRPAR